ncbi:MAG: hypothetical protein V4469_04590 [Patescibacteria group bacterium]
MKKILYTIGILALIIAISVNIVNATIVTVDSYNESNINGSTPVRATGSTEYGEVFQSTISGKITSAKFFVRRQASPTGNVYAKLFASTGTYGSTAVPTGPALGTSDPIDITTISTSQGPVEFTFSGLNQFTMVSGVNYAIGINFNGGDGTNYLLAYYDDSSPTYAGNAWRDTVPDRTSSTPFASIDFAFYVYGDNASGGSSAVVNTSGQKMMMGMAY